MDTKSNKKAFLIGMLVSFLVCSFLGIVLVAVIFGVNSIQGKKIVSSANDAFTEEEMQKLAAYKDKLKTLYYKEIDDETILDGMLEGMMASTDDPYTCYYSVSEMEEMKNSMQGTFYGIGAYLQADLERGYARISGVMKESPAGEAGIMENDYIIYVDDEDMYDKELEYVVSKVRGPEGTTVKLTLNRNGDMVEVDVVRREIVQESVKYELKEDNIAYITLTEFTDVTSEQFSEAMQQAQTDGTEGMILDLRGNPGGNLTAVVAVCEQLLPEGLIVYTEDRFGGGKKFTSTGKNEYDKPMIVLIDGGSASAAEILAGAIKDYEKGTLVGTNTFGKGIVQSVFEYSDGSGGKLTISRYFTPKGINIHEVGIAPDIEIPFDVDKYLNDQTDNQYEEAVKLLKEKMQ